MVRIVPLCLEHPLPTQTVPPLFAEVFDGNQRRLAALEIHNYLWWSLEHVHLTQPHVDLGDSFPTYFRRTIDLTDALASLGLHRVTIRLCLLKSTSVSADREARFGITDYREAQCGITARGSLFVPGPLASYHANVCFVSVPVFTPSRRIDPRVVHIDHLAAAPIIPSNFSQADALDVANWRAHHISAVFDGQALLMPSGSTPLLDIFCSLEPSVMGDYFDWIVGALGATADANACLLAGKKVLTALINTPLPCTEAGLQSFRTSLGQAIDALFVHMGSAAVGAVCAKSVVDTCFLWWKRRCEREWRDHTGGDGRPHAPP